MPQLHFFSGRRIRIGTPRVPRFSVSSAVRISTAPVIFTPRGE